ncbi:MAG TPA: Bax inhibitor-1/YccA family protein [Solirubrobacteraceae bacterium]|nr:Bax inhibitor-1/YccA family protein [Solirubrobacteraceae bacterium]
MSPAYEATAAFGSEAAVAERDFLRQVFAWMFLALAVTTGVAIYFHQSHAALNFFARHTAIFYIALFGQFAMVFALSRVMNSQRISVRTAALLFFLYAGLTGLVFSILLDVYTTDSIVGAFAGAAGVFVGMAALGYTTRVDLGRIRGVLYGALFGLVVASVAFVFTGGSAFNLVLGYVGVLVFSGLTAYHMQALKTMRAQGFANAETAEKIAIFGALLLYLDFINLFISLLRIFGGARR